MWTKDCQHIWVVQIRSRVLEVSEAEVSLCCGHHLWNCGWFVQVLGSDTDIALRWCKGAEWGYWTCNKVFTETTAIDDEHYFIEILGGLCRQYVPLFYGGLLCQSTVHCNLCMCPGALFELQCWSHHTCSCRAAPVWGPVHIKLSTTQFTISDKGSEKDTIATQILKLDTIWTIRLHCGKVGAGG